MKRISVKKHKTFISGTETTVVLRYLRIAPRKVRLVAHMLKGLSVNEAQAQLALHARRAAVPLSKLLFSGLSSALGKKSSAEKLAIKDIRVDKGPMLKRWMPRAQGRATPIQKHTSHIVITLAEIDQAVPPRFVMSENRAKLKKSERDRKRSTTEAKKDSKEKESKKETKAEVSEKGFSKRIFRRKSV